MKSSFRQTEILDIARQSGKVTVEGLAAHFEVTVQTIRRDLSELDEAGHLSRVHGGAVLSSRTRNLGYDQRRGHLAEEKAAIAKVCAAAIPDGSSVFLNIGTTTEAVAAELLQHQALLVITNNMNVANILARNPACDVVVTGGSVRRSDGGLIGTMTVDSIRSFKFDYAVIGCSAIDMDGDVLDYDVQEVGVSQAIIAQAKDTFLLADHSKFGRSAPAKICTLREINTIFTDRPAPDTVVAAAALSDTLIAVAEPT